MSNVLAVFGGQWGSEGKGVVVNRIAHEYDIHVRVGGPNAGHSFNHEGRVWKMQSVPCGWTNPNADLVIGRGALVSLEQLSKELAEIAAVDPSIYQRVNVDQRAGVINPGWHNEGHTDGAIHHRIGSTGEGIGAARVARTNRDPNNFQHFGEVADSVGLGRIVHPDTAGLLNKAIESGQNVLMEGTQGAGLSLIHGPWPYVTSTDVSVAQMCADMGIPVSKVNERLMVVRTFPIRVAGNSGPMYGEMTWDQMTERLGKPVVERTTVTQKIRRVGQWDESLVARSIMLNDPTSAAIMFLDYLNPADEGKLRVVDLSEASVNFLRYFRSTYPDVPVSLLGTGGERWEVIDTGLPL